MSTYQNDVIWEQLHEAVILGTLSQEKAERMTLEEACAYLNIPNL